MERSALVEHRWACGAIHAAGGRENESPNASLLGQSCQVHRGEVVDVIGQPRVQVPERVVGERGEVQDGLEAPQIVGFDVAKISDNTWDVCNLAHEAIVRKKITIQTHNCISSRAE